MSEPQLLSFKAKVTKLEPKSGGKMTWVFIESADASNPKMVKAWANSAFHSSLAVDREFDFKVERKEEVKDGQPRVEFIVQELDGVRQRAKGGGGGGRGGGYGGGSKSAAEIMSSSYSGVIKSCIESGTSMEDAEKWCDLLDRRMSKHLLAPPAPGPAPKEGPKAEKPQDAPLAAQGTPAKTAPVGYIVYVKQIGMSADEQREFEGICKDNGRKPPEVTKAYQESGRQPSINDLMLFAGGKVS